MSNIIAIILIFIGVTLFLAALLAMGNGLFFMLLGFSIGFFGSGIALVVANARYPGVKRRE